MLKRWLARPRALLAGAALSAVLAAPLMLATPAEAAWGHGGGWHSGWGWHGGWGFRGGVVVGVPVPRVVVGAPIYPYPYVGYHWVPPHYTPWGAFVPGHWGY